MARQESQSKALYYPTPLEPVVRPLATWFAPASHFVRLADPCVGEGHALRLLADNIQAPRKETWGVELSYARAELAEKLIDVVLPTSFSIARWAPRSVSLLFNNPPYDWSDQVDSRNKRMRLEEVFLIKGTEKIATNGIHILIVPQWILGREGAARHWTGWYSDTTLMRFPDGEFEAFGQVVLIGVKRAKYQQPTNATLEAFMAQGEGPLPVIYEGDGQYQLPTVPAFAAFEYTPLDDRLVAKNALRVNPLGSQEWQRQTYVRPVGASINPLVQLKVGHLSMLISAGELGVVKMNLDDGPVLVKGTLDKVMRTNRDDITDEDGNITGQRVEQIEELRSVISLMRSDGNRELLTGTQQVADFITEYAGPLADAVLEHNKPFYTWEPTLDEWRRAGRVALGLPPLPGRQERGLFDVQKHFAIAAARFMRDGNKVMGSRGWKHVVINAEMGFGKSATAVGVLEQRNRWPVLVMCPGHMVFKWVNQLHTASDPDNPIQARVITRPARAEKSWLHREIVPILAEYGGTLDRDERWQVEPVGDYDTGLRRRLTVKAPSRPGTIKVFKKDGEIAEQFVPNMRMGLLNELAKRVKVKKDIVPIRKQLTTDGFTIEFMDRDEYTMADFYDDVTFGRLGPKPVAVVSFEPAKYDAGVRQLDLKWKYFHIYCTEEDRPLTVKAPVCPGCGKPLGATWTNVEGTDEWIWMTDNPVYQDETGRWIMDLSEFKMPDVCPHFDQHVIRGDDGKPVMQNGKPLLAQRFCKTRLYEMSRWRRVGLSRLVQRKYKHWFQVYVADEVHEGKSADTDIGTADGRFISSIENSLALTGTLFGGTASSLFYLFFRRNPEVRANYDYKDGRTTWVDHFGLWRYRWSEKVCDDDDPYARRGRSSGIKRWDVRPPQELPGVSPAVARYLLPLTLFGKITDLGYVLPPLHDQVQTVAMSEPQEAQYLAANRELLNMALERVTKFKDTSMLATWFSTCRYRPMSAFRTENVVWKDNPIMTLPSVFLLDNHGIPLSQEALKARSEKLEADRLAGNPITLGYLPKEERLAELVRENIKRGRKTLVFVEQTGTRDIRGRLLATLKELIPGVRAYTLSSDEVKPAKREMWIKRHAADMQVLLVNAGLVKTGLDLVMFSDIIFYETNTSLYTVWQAMRRVWRLGQKNNVTTTFLAYKDTIEEQMLDRMGKKMKAAMLLYGDSAAGALVDTGGDDDIAREIIRAALEGKTIESVGDINGMSIFGNGDEHAVLVSNSPMGSPVAQTPTMVVTAPAVVTEPEPIPLDSLQQLGLFGELVAVAPPKKRRR